MCHDVDALIPKETDILRNSSTAIGHTEPKYEHPQHSHKWGEGETGIRCQGAWRKLVFVADKPELKRSWSIRTQHKRLLLSWKHEFMLVLDKYYITITVSSWANHASRPDGVILCPFLLEGHFWSINSRSVLFYASVLSGLFWSLRERHCRFSCLTGRR